MAGRQIRMSIDSRIENVGLVGLAVSRLSTLTPISEVGRYQIELCAVEAVTNAIVHAYGREPGHEVEVDVCLDEQKIVLRISDRGSPMRFEKRTRLDFDCHDLSSVPEHGMGLRLINQSMSDVFYEVDDGRNTMTMIKYFNQASAGIKTNDAAGG